MVRPIVLSHQHVFNPIGPTWSPWWPNHRSTHIRAFFSNLFEGFTTIISCMSLFADAVHHLYPIRTHFPFQNRQELERLGQRNDLCPSSPIPHHSPTQIDCCIWCLPCPWMLLDEVGHPKLSDSGTVGYTFGTERRRHGGQHAHIRRSIGMLVIKQVQTTSALESATFGKSPSVWGLECW